MPFRFEGLEIWKRARDFSTKIHEVTVNFPRHEMYGLTDQINRASDAVSLLIAEGSGLQTNALFSHRLGLAVGETFEVVSGSFLALDRKYTLPKSKLRCMNGVMHSRARSTHSETR
jgi:four helix bundle protein